MGTSNRSQLPEGQVSKSQLLGRPYVWASYWEPHAHVTGKGPGASSQIGCEPWGLTRLGVSSWGEQGDLGPAPGLDCLSTTTGGIKYLDTIYKNTYTCVCVCVCILPADFDPDQAERRNRLFVLCFVAVLHVCVYAGKILLSACVDLLIFLSGIHCPPLECLNLGTRSHSSLAFITILDSTACNKDDHAAACF